MADQDQLGMVVQEAVDGVHGRDFKSGDLKELQIRELAEGRWKDVVRQAVGVVKAEGLQRIPLADIGPDLEGRE